MNLLDEMVSRLIEGAESLGWESQATPLLTARNFRGRETDAEVRLPDNARGIMLGRYPVLVSEISLASQEQLVADLKAAHNQMIIARSYLRSEQIIDAHILFVIGQTQLETDWRRQIDRIERDETVCRKLVWMPHIASLDDSFAAFRDRTFLSRPWTITNEQSDAPLDENEELVERVLRAKGLSQLAAATWVQLAQSGLDDTDLLIEQLVASMEL